MKEFNKLCETIKNNFSTYDYIVFNIKDFNNIGIFTDENILYIINQLENSLNVIDFENEDDVNKYDKEYWRLIEKEILKGKPITTMTRHTVDSKKIGG